MSEGLSWIGIFRLGLVQTALGSVVILTTSTLNRVMVVELALPAMIPGFLVSLHYAVQMSRPRLGYGSDIGGRRTPWIIGGILTLGIGATGASAATMLMAIHPTWGFILSLIAFLLIGIGVGAAGTSLLVLLAKLVDGQRKPAAATIVWIMMIVGFVVTTTVVGHYLDPFSLQKLILITALVSILALSVTLLAVWNLEENAIANKKPEAPIAKKPEFMIALKEVWQEKDARIFTLFVFFSMLAYSTQDLILEPFAGAVFGMSPGASTQLSGVHHAGVLLGMLIVALVATLGQKAGVAALRRWTVGGCIASAIALVGLVRGGFDALNWQLDANVFVLGIANGSFAVAAIASMMMLAGYGSSGREGLRMGLWGAAQAIAFGLGGFLGTVGIDVASLIFTELASVYGLVFSIEALLFLLAAVIGLRVKTPELTNNKEIPSFGEIASAEILGGR